MWKKTGLITIWCQLIKSYVIDALMLKPWILSPLETSCLTMKLISTGKQNFPPGFSRNFETLLGQSVGSTFFLWCRRESWWPSQQPCQWAKSAVCYEKTTPPPRRHKFIFIPSQAASHVTVPDWLAEQMDPLGILSVIQTVISKNLFHYYIPVSVSILELFKNLHF